MAEVIQRLDASVELTPTSVKEDFSVVWEQFEKKLDGREALEVFAKLLINRRRRSTPHNANNGDINAKLERLESTITDQGKRIGTLEKEVTEKTTEIEVLKTQVRALEEENTTLRLKVQFLEEENTTLQLKVQFLETENAAVKRRLAKIEDESLPALERLCGGMPKGGVNNVV